jgi:hypothetical protein
VIKILALMLALAGVARAEDDADFRPEDALYAPEEATPTAQESGAPEARGASYYSSARVVAVDLGRGGREIEGAEIFIGGRYLGKSPLDLEGFLVDAPLLSLSARLPGYAESLRPALRVPPEGEIRVGLAGDNAASWYTTPSFVAGILMLAGAAASYAQNTPSGSETGAALLGGGVGVILISQAVARLFHLPALHKRVEAWNASHEPLL